MLLGTIFVGLVLLYSLCSRKLQQTVITAPVVMTTAGILTMLLLPQVRGLEGLREVSLGIAETGLVLLLFADASRTNLQLLRSIRALPTRLLTTGMLLTILLGIVAARLVFPELTIWEAGILAAILAPTDAGLGQVIVESPQVPIRIRQALNVEAGLNDGLSVPFLLLFIALAEASSTQPALLLLRYAFEQIGLGCIIGIIIGGIGGWLLNRAIHKGWITESLQGVGLVALPILCAITSEAVHASMFIAAFVAGLAVQLGFKEAGEHSLEFTHSWGECLNWFVFFLFGLLTVPLWKELTLQHLVYAILSLTVIRMLPVALALVGTHLRPATLTFMGWFGPRGLASIVLGLVYLEMQKVFPGEATIRLTVVLTVLLSVYAHGITALPGISLYRKCIASIGSTAAEYRDGSSMITPASS